MGAVDVIVVLAAVLVPGLATVRAAYAVAGMRARSSIELVGLGLLVGFMGLFIVGRLLTALGAFDRSSLLVALMAWLLLACAAIVATRSRSQPSHPGKVQTGLMLHLCRDHARVALTAVVLVVVMLLTVIIGSVTESVIDSGFSDVTLISSADAIREQRASGEEVIVELGIANHHAVPVTYAVNVNGAQRTATEPCVESMTLDAGEARRLQCRIARGTVAVLELIDSTGARMELALP